MRVRVLAAIALLVAANGLRAGVNVWTSNAPTHGDVQALLADPRMSGVLYARIGLGVFRTEDGGVLWEQLPPLPELTFQMAAPSDPQLLYAAYYRDVARSTDAGMTWTTVGRLPTEITALRVDPATSTTVYAYGSALYRSTDAGETWADATGDLPRGTSWVDLLAIDPHKPATLYARIGNSLYRSRNGGANWTPISNAVPGVPTVFTADPAHPGVLYLNSLVLGPVPTGTVFRSNDGGDNWHPTSFSTPPYVRDIAVSASGRFVYATASDLQGNVSVWTSPDAGASWRSTSLDRSALSLAVDPVDDSTLWAAGEGVVRSADAGATWTPADTGLITGGASAVALTDDSSLLYAASRNLGVFSSGSHGAAWTYPRNYDGPAGPIAIPRGQTLTLYAGQSGGDVLGSSGLFRSTDGGETFEHADAGLTGIVVSVGIDPKDASKMLVGTIPLPPPGFVRAGKPAEDFNALFSSTDAGRSWTKLPPITAGPIIYEPVNAVTVYAGTYKSTDGGATWFGLPPGSVPVLALDPTRPTNVYSAGRSTVSRSTDGGQTWSHFSAGLPPSAELRLITVDPSLPTTLYAAGDGGVFRSADSGETWSALGGSSNPGHVKSLTVEASGRFVHVATDRGVFDYEIGINPAPALDVLRPNRALPNGPAFTLVVRGFGFTGESTITWNGTPRPTSFLSTRALATAVGAGDLAIAGKSSIAVVNAAPGGGVSNALPFLVEGLNPPPSITSLSPSSVASGGPSFIFDISGSGFGPGSQVLWNGSPLPTRFLSPGLLTASAEANTPGMVTITVVNPAPGGGLSNGAAFRVDPVSATRLIPVVLDVRGAAHYTSELILTNRGTSPSTLHLTYVAAEAIGATGSGTVSESLPAGQQMLVPDAISYLRSKGLLIPDTGPQVGTLRIDFAGLSTPNAGYAAARTTFPAGAGRVGPLSPGVRVENLFASKARVIGLRENPSERSNLALINAGDAGDVTLRVTLTASAGKPTGLRLRDITLGPGQWTQLGSVLARAGLSEGYATVERVGGEAPFLSYGVINDNVTNDGSVIPGDPLPSDHPTAVLPFVVTTDNLRTELVLMNERTDTVHIALQYAASPDPGGAPSFHIFDEEFGPEEQRVIPNALEHLRNTTAPQAGVEPSRGTLTELSCLSCLLFARTSAPAEGGGRYTVSYGALPLVYGPADAWVYGLQQSSTARSNVAVLNPWEYQGETLSLLVELYDGARGELLETLGPVALAPGQWIQFDSVLAKHGVAHGYAHVVRVSGFHPFEAYGVINDGPTPGSGSGGGAFVPMELP